VYWVSKDQTSARSIHVILVADSDRKKKKKVCSETPSCQIRSLLGFVSSFARILVVRLRIATERVSAQRKRGIASVSLNTSSNPIVSLDL
jgi:hypothetical protein